MLFGAEGLTWKRNHLSTSSREVDARDPNKKGPHCAWTQDLISSASVYLQVGNLSEANRVWKSRWFPALVFGMYWFTYQKVQSSEGSMTMLL